MKAFMRQNPSCEPPKQIRLMEKCSRRSYENVGNLCVIQTFKKFCGIETLDFALESMNRTLGWCFPQVLSGNRIIIR